MLYRQLSLPASQLPAAKKPPLQSPVWSPLPLGVLKQGCLWISLSSCTATFTSTNTIFLCKHFIPWEMTERAKKRRRKGRNQGDRRDLGDTGDPWRTNLVGGHVSGINNVIRHLMMFFLFLQKLHQKVPFRCCLYFFCDALVLIMMAHHTNSPPSSSMGTACVHQSLSLLLSHSLALSLSPLPSPLCTHTETDVSSPICQSQFLHLRCWLVYVEGTSEWLSLQWDLLWSLFEVFFT